VIETDDQTAESMRVMENVNSMIADHGATFSESFVNYSLCCPSRATFLTGQYAHNHRILSNAPPEGGFPAFERAHGTNNLAVWLKRAGYHTGLVGKYLNSYGGGAHPELVPPGWSEWYATTGGTAGLVYGYELNENGTVVPYGTDPADYKQDVFTEKAVDFVDRRAQAAKPFFLWLTYTAPHFAGPNPNPNPPTDCDGTAAKPAPRHAHSFDTEPLPEPPSFNEADVSDKPAFIRAKPLLDAAAIDEVTRRYRCELEELLSVDDGAAKKHDALRQQGALRDTYVVYTSDNGYFHGEHRIPREKLHTYEESIRVPLLIRGPSVPHGVSVRDLAVNADLAPTIVSLAGARPRLVMDGRSLLPLARHPTVERGRELPIETRTYKAIRTRRYIYVRYRSGERELYDLRKDPYELESLHADPAHAAVRRALAKRLRRLKRCEGRGCRIHPHLTLDLEYREGRRDGRRCALDPIHAEVMGRDADAAVEAEFIVDGELVDVDRHPPFRRALPESSLDRDGLTAVRVRVTMLDGRRMTLDRHVRACR